MNTKEKYVVLNYEKILNERCGGNEDMAQEAICRLLEKNTKTSFSKPSTVLGDIIKSMKKEFMNLEAFKVCYARNNNIDMVTEVIFTDFLINDIRALKVLNEIEREVVVDIFVDDMCIADVAKDMDISLRAVNQILDEATGKIKDYLTTNKYVKVHKVHRTITGFKFIDME